MNKTFVLTQGYTFDLDRFVSFPYVFCVCVSVCTCRVIVSRWSQVTKTILGVGSCRP